MNYKNTRAVAKRLGVPVSSLSQAVWRGDVSEPERAPGGSFLWTDTDIRSAAKALGISLKFEPIIHRPVSELIKERKELSLEAFQNGWVAYIFGGCDDELIGEAIQSAIATAKEADFVIAGKLSGQTLTDDEIDNLVMRTYLIMGIYRAFLLKTQGKFKKEVANE